MSFPTKPAYIHTGTWDTETDSHPAMKWMHTYTTDVIDARKFSTPLTDHHTSDFVYVGSDGSAAAPGEASWAGAAETYAPFTATLHQPYYLACTETAYGYEMIGQAWLFANFAGSPSAGETKVSDGEGKEWDVKIPGGFRFQYKKVGEGFRLQRSEVMSDKTPALMILLKRGLLSPAALGL